MSGDTMADKITAKDLAEKKSDFVIIDVREAIKKQVKNNAVTFLLSLTCVEFWKHTSSSASAATTSLLCNLYFYFFFSLETDKIKSHFYNYFLS
jgi:hypothetical protein